MSGPIFQLPGSSNREDVQGDSIIAGLNIQFGGKRKNEPLRDAVTQATAIPVNPAAQTASPPPDLNATGGQ
jgi:hypothetical protein